MTTRKGLGNFVLLWAAMLPALTLLAPVARAQDFSKRCDGTTHLMADGRIVDGRLGNNAGDNIVWFRFTTLPGVSYSIEAHMPVQPASATPTVDVFNVGDVDLLVQCSTGPSTVTTRNTTAIAPLIRHNGMRVSVTGTGNDLFVRVTAFLGQVLSMQLSETTLYNPLWSTFGGFETFYRFQNSTNSACNATLRMVNDAGTEVANTTIPMMANSTAPTIFTGPMAPGGGLGLADNQAGQAVITHNCPPGAIQVDGFTGRFDLAAPVVLPIKIEAARQMR